jgi:hypothetical protein
MPTDVVVDVLFPTLKSSPSLDTRLLPTASFARDDLGDVTPTPVTPIGRRLHRGALCGKPIAATSRLLGRFYGILAICEQGGVQDEDVLRRRLHPHPFPSYLGDSQVLTWSLGEDDGK